MENEKWNSSDCLQIHKEREKGRQLILGPEDDWIQHKHCGKRQHRCQSHVRTSIALVSELEVVGITTRT